jgi:hypothetical protein
MNQFPPKPLSSPLGPFQIFLTFMEIFTAQGAPLVSMTLVANGKIFNRKSSNFLFGHLWVVELTYRYIFSLKFILRC